MDSLRTASLRRILIVAVSSLAAAATLVAPARASDHLLEVNEVMVSTGGNPAAQFVELLDPFNEPFPSPPYKLVVFDANGNRLGAHELGGDANIIDSNVPMLISTPAADAALGVKGDQALSVPLPTAAGQITYTRGPGEQPIHTFTWGCINTPVSSFADQGPAPPDGQSAQRQANGAITLGAPTPKAQNSSGTQTTACPVPTGKLEVRLVLSPANDLGRFNLQIDGTTRKADAANADMTGERMVNAGNRTVGETAGTGTTLAGYASAISCKDQNGSGSEIASASNVGPLTVAVAQDADVVCTITNTRGSGSIEVIEKLDPATDPGRFDLQIDGITRAQNATNDSTTGPVTVNTATNHSVGETAAAGARLSDYTSAIACKRNGGAAEGGPGTNLAGIIVNKDDAVVCTITNTRTLPAPPGPPAASLGAVLPPLASIAPDTVAPRVGVSRRALRLSPGGFVSVRLSCPATEPSGCAGTLRLETAGMVRLARARKLTLGKAAFKMSGGSTVGVKVRLSKAKQRLVSRLGRLSVRAIVLARDSAGNSGRSGVVVRLNARRVR
jgi:hypothetical protein